MNYLDIDTSFVRVDLDKFGIIEIKKGHYTAEDDYDIDETISIDPYNMDKYLAKRFGFYTDKMSFDDISDLSINITFIKQVNDDTWYFDTNYGSIELSIDELERIF